MVNNTPIYFRQVIVVDRQSCTLIINVGCNFISDYPSLCTLIEALIF